MQGTLRLGRRFLARGCATAPDPATIADKYTEQLANFAARAGRPPVRLTGIRYDGTTKRFYQQVDVEETLHGYAPTLGGRMIQTVGGHLIIVPSKLLADAIAFEWDYQTKYMKPHLMPLMHLTTQAIDQVPNKRQAMLDTVLGYVDFDSVCLRDFELPALGRVQTKYFDPVVAWFEERFGVKLNVKSEDDAIVEPVVQTGEMRRALVTRLSELTDWEYTAFDQCCGVSHSIIISLAVVEGQLDLLRAYECAKLEDNFAMRQNGHIRGALGHDIDIEFAKTRLAAARSFVNMINFSSDPAFASLAKQNSMVTPPPQPQGKTLETLRRAAAEDNNFLQ